MRSSGLLTKDMVAGLLFVITGLTFLYLGWGYRFGTSRQMGPGYFPIVLSALLIGLGALVCLTSIKNRSEALEAVSYKGLIFVLGATFAFAMLIRPAGMPVAIFVLAFFGSMASSNFKPVQSVLLGVGLAVFSVVVFNWALGMPFPVLGYWFR